MAAKGVGWEGLPSSTPWIFCQKNGIRYFPGRVESLILQQLEVNEFYGIPRGVKSVAKNLQELFALFFDRTNPDPHNS